MRIRLYTLYKKVFFTMETRQRPLILGYFAVSALYSTKCYKLNLLSFPHFTGYSLVTVVPSILQLFLSFFCDRCLLIVLTPPSSSCLLLLAHRL